MDFISLDDVEATLEELKKQVDRARIDKDSPSLKHDLDIKYQRTQVLYKEGRFKEAETLESQRLLVLVALHGFADKRTIRSMDTLSSLRFNAKEQQGGGDLLDTAIALRIETQGANHPDTLASLASKVAHLQNLGQFPEAVQLGQYVVDMCKGSLARSDPARLRGMSNLASVYASGGDPTKAEELLLEILRIREETLPYDDPDTVRSRVNLSGVYFGQKRWKDAVLLLEPVLSLRRRTMGDSHPMTMSIARQLAYAYSELKGQTDNLTIQLLILNTAKKTYGEDHEQTLDALLGLVPTYIQRRMWKDAIETTEQILEKQKRRLPADDPMIIDLSSHLDTLMREFPNRECKVSDVSNIVYRPLSLDSRQIRIAYITKGSRSDPLEATLLRTSLDALPSYEALSYVWGRDQSVAKLALNGHCINITPSLQGAMMQLRSSTEDRLIWIDAICINQEDPEERSKQVQLMRDIYSNAKRVIVWLGEEAEDTKAGVEFLKALEVHSSPKEHAADVLRAAPSNLTAILNGIRELLLDRSYWNRLWIVQEVMCAKDLVVHCGSLTVGYEILGKVYDIILQAILILVQEQHPATPRYLRIVNQLSGGGGQSSWREPTSTCMPLEELLRAHWSSECSDPKDRIYALLGISSLKNSTHLGLKVDYSKSTSEVYRGATKAIIEETGRLGVLCLVTEAGTHAVTKTYRARQPFLPSWVPDWNVHRRTAISLARTNPLSKISENARAKFEFSSDGTCLDVTGLGISSLEHCGKRFEMVQMRLKDIMTLFLGWRQSIVDYSRPSRRGGPDIWLRKFYSMLNPDKPDTWLVTEADWARWELTSVLPGPVDSALSEREKQFLRTTYQFCVGRRLCYLKDSGPGSLDGYNLGLCPNEATEGDLLCAVLGCPVPIILHPVDEHFLVVGEAYVPDYMSGEAMEGNPPLQIFTLH
ncbi:heterokaryon incompatibility protein-domain-containing protein [Pyrenochaeta sp. MPI-SDFR-AT-0127]|nr:heterokaryon incompatibility protein-domain-containing protein [Pyrenochaeta sp. MPI-SDFR-AT-0127]